MGSEQGSLRVDGRQKLVRLLQETERPNRIQEGAGSSAFGSPWSGQQAACAGAVR